MIAWTGIEHFRVGRYDPPPPAEDPEDFFVRFLNIDKIYELKAILYRMIYFPIMISLDASNDKFNFRKRHMVNAFQTINKISYHCDLLHNKVISICTRTLLSRYKIQMTLVVHVIAENFFVVNLNCTSINLFRLHKFNLCCILCSYFINLLLILLNIGVFSV